MKKLVIFSSLVFLLAACSSLVVTSDVDDSADFSKYQTFSYYGWSKNSDKVINDITKQRIEDAFAEEFKKRGFTFVKEGGDATVSLYIVVDEKTSVTAYTDHYGGAYNYGWGYGYGRPYGYPVGPPMGQSTTTYHEDNYKTGTLICDVLDADEKKLIWQGLAAAVIDENPRKREYRIKEAVQKMMKEYPIKPVKK